MNKKIRQKTETQQSKENKHVFYLTKNKYVALHCFNYLLFPIFFLFHSLQKIYNHNSRMHLINNNKFERKKNNYFNNFYFGFTQITLRISFCLLTMNKTHTILKITNTLPNSDAPYNYIVNIM